MASGVAFEWVIDPVQAWSAGYDQWSHAVKAAILQLANFYAPQIEAWMKDNALWEDQTGNARQSLHTGVRNYATSVVIELGYGVEYGKYLELSNAGQYAIIGPALDHWGPIISQAVQAVFG